MNWEVVEVMFTMARLSLLPHPTNPPGGNAKRDLANRFRHRQGS